MVWKMLSARDRFHVLSYMGRHRGGGLHAIVSDLRREALGEVRPARLR